MLSFCVAFSCDVEEKPERLNGKVRILLQGGSFVRIYVALSERRTRKKYNMFLGFQGVRHDVGMGAEKILK